ncbi:phenylacetate-CoA oxygenase subunit PaaJ [Pilimelia anulata]|uniref:Phenylacetate-CoA oxygenase subunit PaaJ n=1 Tax=Pilimelia anulata TaxID=53371 RepID=A0A8J3F915_9ACTN|nr:1,2-phenylacetyl-CoA epoxidase subunit PaaD [Pilimelia anulata]GGJ95357.1 phenylacetate-CoA oxygenase subunit PaaJ [Pilimelia anulata]
MLAPPDGAWAAAAAVPDPELRVISIAELGILRDVAVDADGAVTVTITPTYTGCPAMDAIRADVRRAVRAAGYGRVAVVTVLDPAWSTEDITAAGRAKLAAAGVAPPTARGPAGPVPVRLSVRCPRCGTMDTEELSRFGSTACKALYRCRACAEPFDHFKPL